MFVCGTRKLVYAVRHAHCCSFQNDFAKRQRTACQAISSQYFAGGMMPERAIPVQQDENDSHATVTQSAMAEAGRLGNERGRWSLAYVLRARRAGIGS